MRAPVSCEPARVASRQAHQPRRPAASGGIRARLGRTLVIALLATVVTRPAAQAQQILQLSSGAYAVPTASGEVQLWREGETKFFFRGGFPQPQRGLRRPLALVTQLGRGPLVLVVRSGPVLAFEPPQRPIFKLPLLGDFDVAGAPSGDWTKNILSTDRVSAAAVTSDGRLVLASDRTGRIFVVAPVELFADPADTVLLGAPRLHYRDDATSVVDLPGFPTARYSTMLRAPLGASGETISGIAVCDQTLVAGSSDGSVYFLALNGGDTDARARQVAARADKGPASVQDIGCLADGLAYTVTVAPGGGEIQLWDLAARSILERVDTAVGPGVPLITSAAVASNDGRRLLGLGNAGIQILRVKSRRLEEIASLKLDNASLTYSAGRLGEAGFVVSDGVRLYRLGSDLSALVQIAGPPGPNQRPIPSSVAARRERVVSTNRSRRSSRADASRPAG